MLLRERPLNIISFDSACKNLISKPKSFGPKPKKKQIRSIFDLGARIDATPSYFSKITPRKTSRSFQNSSLEANQEGDEDNILNGMFSPFMSHTDSKLMRCNTIIMNSSKSDVVRKIWKSIASLGMVSGESESITVKLVEDMEERDKLGLKILK